jgi:hypothetical protein
MQSARPATPPAEAVPYRDGLCGTPRAICRRCQFLYLVGCIVIRCSRALHIREWPARCCCLAQAASVPVRTAGTCAWCPRTALHTRTALQHCTHAYSTARRPYTQINCTHAQITNRQTDTRTDQRQAYAQINDRHMHTARTHRCTHPVSLVGVRREQRSSCCRVASRRCIPALLFDMVSSLAPSRGAW